MALQIGDITPGVAAPTPGAGRGGEILRIVQQP